MATTRWVDTSLNSLEEVICKVQKSLSKLSESNDPIGTGASGVRQNWAVKDGYHVEYVKVKEREIPYCKFDFSYDTTFMENVSHTDFFVIAFMVGSTVYYIINKSSKDQLHLRKILGYSGKHEVERVSYSFDKEFLFWLIYRVYEKQTELENGIGGWELSSIKGVKGSTADLQSVVSAKGESVMNIISTLTFLLESSELNRINLNMGNSSHENISIEVNNNNIDLEIASYQGIFESDNNRDAKVYVLTYIEILPLLMQVYEEDKENDAWNSNVRKEFMKSIASDVTNRINHIAEDMDES